MYVILSQWKVGMAHYAEMVGVAMLGGWCSFMLG